LISTGLSFVAFAVFFLLFLNAASSRKPNKEGFDEDSGSAL
jgi:hypothetical protein